MKSSTTIRGVVLPLASALSFGWLMAAVLVSDGASPRDSRVVKLDESNWTLTLKDEWMLEFMAPWCPACTSLKGTWDDLGSHAKTLGISVAEIDVTSAPGLSGRFLVTALPTIYHVVNGEFRQYKGPRDHESLYSYVKAEKWRATEPVPWWKNPNSVQMTCVSYFFTMSLVLREVHIILLERYSLPTWGSYLIFALATILLGSIIGLLMVACIDFLYPQKASGRKPQPLPTQKPDEVPNDDLIDEDEDVSENYETDEDAEKNSQSDTPASDSDAEPIKAAENSGSGASDKDASASPNVRKRKAVRKEK